MSKLGLKHLFQNDHIDSRSKEVRSKKFDGRKKVYMCTLCDFQTLYRKSLDKHQQIHLPPGERQLFPCAHCDKKYTSKTNVQHHLQNNHIDFRAKELNKLQKKVYRCSTCSYQARDMSGLRQHNLVHLAPEERQMFACAHCEKKYTLKRNLRRHLTDDHTDTRMKESQKNVHRCSTCSYQTRDISTLRQHEKLHLAPEERQMFVCTQCGKKFSRKYDLKRHLKRRIHSRSKVQERVYRCAICGFQFKHRQSLYRHKKVHLAPEKRQMFTCAKCDRKYRLKKSLQCHLKRDHVDSRSKVQERVYRCAICGFPFKHRQSLYRHKKVHLAPEKRQMFTCAKCDRKYRLKKSLQCHLKRDHVDSRSKVQKRVYRCAICGFQSKHRQSLHRHKKVHLAPEKRQMFTCTKCDRKYILKKTLQCHLKRDHVDSRNSDCTSPTDEVILCSLKMEIDDYTPHLDDFKHAERLAMTNKVKSEDFLKIEPDDVTPTMNTDMQDDFKNTENLSVTKKLYIKLEDFIKMEPKYDDEDARF